MQRAKMVDVQFLCSLFVGFMSQIFIKITNACLASIESGMFSASRDKSLILSSQVDQMQPTYTVTPGPGLHVGKNQSINKQSTCV